MVTRTDYFPERGDIVWIDMDPQAGHEQAGRRPAVVLSPGSYNRRTGLAIFCPVTSRVKGIRFEVALPKDLKVSGVALSDQIKNLDWSVRRAAFICTVPLSTLDEILDRTLTVLGIPEELNTDAQGTA